MGRIFYDHISEESVLLFPEVCSLKWIFCNEFHAGRFKKIV